MLGLVLSFGRQDGYGFDNFYDVRSEFRFPNLMFGTFLPSLMLEFFLGMLAQLDATAMALHGGRKEFQKEKDVRREEKVVEAKSDLN